MAWIALDAGTSVIKAVAFNHLGGEIAVARERTDVLHPRPEFSEQSMEAVWSAAVKTIRLVAEQIEGPIEGLALTAQGDGCWLIKDDSEPCGNALLWNDGRAASIVEHWRTSGIVERAYARSGSVAYPGLSHALLAWLSENHPDRLQGARWALSCNGWLFHRLTGKIAADLSDASNPFSDVRKKAYDDELFAMFGLQSLRAMFPAIVEGDSQSARLCAEVAESIGLKRGLQVVMAPYDIVATAYGVGVTSPGQACVILGTTICTEVITAKLDLSGPAVGTTIALGEDLHLRAMPTLAGCETLEWAARMLGVDSLSNLEMLASASPAGARGVLFLPYLSEAGERSPFLDPQACGSFHGFKLSHAQCDMARAVYEGVSYAIRECLGATGAAVKEMRVCGGGARSSLWCQVIANVTGVRVLRSSKSELGARGAFLFGLATARESTIAQAASEFPLTFEVFEPSGDPDLYAERYDTFLHTRATVRALWRAKEGS